MSEINDQTQGEMESLSQPIQIATAEGASEFEVLEAQKKIVDKHVARFREWEDWRRPYEMLWTEIYRLYMTTNGVQKLMTRAKVMLPIVFQIVEAGMAKLVSIIFGQPQFFDVVSMNALNPVPDPILEKIQILLKNQLDKASFFTKFIDFAKQLFLYGTSYFYVYWKVRREWVYERTATRQQVTQDGIVIDPNALTWEKTLEYKVIERRPEIDVLPIEAVFPDPEACTVADCRGVYVVTYTSMDQLEELSTGKYPIYSNFAQVKEFGASDRETQFKADKRTIRGTGSLKPTKMGKTSVELITWWGKEDLDGDGIQEEVQIVIANRQTVIKAMRNPFEHQERPIIKACLFPVPLEWYGLGLIEPVIPLVHELVTLRNQNLDMNNLIINRMWKVDSLADVELDTLITSPNGIIITHPMEGVEALNQAEIPYSPREMTGMIQNDIENATTPKSIQGSGESSAVGRTARGAQLIISQALEKFGMGAKLIESEGVKPVLEMCLKLDAQFLDNDDVLDDPQFYGGIFPERLSPEEIRSNITFKMLGLSETITKEAMLNQIIAFVNTWKGLPGVNWTEIAKINWDLMQLKHDSSEIILEQPQMPPMPGAPEQAPQGNAGAAGAIAAQAANNGTGGSISVPQQ